MRPPIAFCLAGTLALLLTAPSPSQRTGLLLDPQTQLDAQSFWDNKDWDWYKANIPFFECPDPQITTTYYYRWELVTKHLTYGSPSSGYSFTEFIDRPFWSGTYGSISCPAGLQLYEVRWLRDPRYARDYSRYWFKTPGAQPRNYSTWLADAIWAVHRVHPDGELIKSLLPDLKANYEAWESRHFTPEIGLFWQTGHDDGMEYNINSRQTADILRGAPAYRPTLNAYLWADAMAIARVAELAGNRELAESFKDRASRLNTNLQARLWDPRRQFFFPMSMRDEERDGFKIKANSLTYQSGSFANSPYGRELIGYVPWQFDMLDPGFDSAWDVLMDRNTFLADFGPTVTERRDPLFLVTDSCCWWSGQSWPYATTQTLKALANLLARNHQSKITKGDYLKLLSIYAGTHKKNGKPYIAEGANPDTGSWKGYDSYNHSEHYFHSGFNDLIITGLVGLKPRDDNKIEVAPLAPEDWAYFAMEQVPYRGHDVGIVWDRTGERYGIGKGLHIRVDGKTIASSERLERIVADLPAARPEGRAEHPASINVAVNNDGQYFPRIKAAGDPETPVRKMIDGNYWYHAAPPNRWVGSRSGSSDQIELDFGTARRIDHVKLYLLEQEPTILPPTKVELESWDGKTWERIEVIEQTPKQPMGRRANLLRFAERTTRKVRVSLTRQPGSHVGLSELEVWGPGSQAWAPASMPVENLAFNRGDQPFPKLTASFTFNLDRPEHANNGRVNFAPNPPDRWTAYESPNASDWLQVDFGEPKEIGRVELAIYDDHGGVQPPASYQIEYWDGATWKQVSHEFRSPTQPAGSEYNESKFDRVQTSRLRVLFQHRARSRSGISEILIWKE